MGFRGIDEATCNHFGCFRNVAISSGNTLPRLIESGYLTLKAVRTVVDDSGRELSRRDFESSRFMMARAAVQVDHMMRVGAEIGTGRAFGQRYGQLWHQKPAPRMMVVTWLGVLTGVGWGCVGGL